MNVGENWKQYCHTINPSQHYHTVFLPSFCPPVVPRRSWRITGGAGSCCLQACTWATWSCVHQWSRLEHWCLRNSPTSSVTQRFETTVTCPGGEIWPVNVAQCTWDGHVVQWVLHWHMHLCCISANACFTHMLHLERSGSGCRPSALLMSRWKWTTTYRALHIASYRTYVAPSRT